MTSSDNSEHHGQCLCGAVRVTVRGPLEDPSACHCGQCRRWTGHVWADVTIPDDRLTIEGGESLRWFRSSEEAERGFCAACGSSMFWRGIDSGRTAVGMGCFEAPTGTRLTRHIYTADKGDYYDIADGLPQRSAG